MRSERQARLDGAELWTVGNFILWAKLDLEHLVLTLHYQLPFPKSSVSYIITTS